MCRFLIYAGQQPILLSHLIISPTHSILTQSYDSRLRLDLTRPHNGDGFGVGYYTALSYSPGTPISPTRTTKTSVNESDDIPEASSRPPPIDLGPEPCIFTSTIPAWNCRNLERLASKTASPLVFAHVRATTEGALSESNCHPFSRGALMWMHNGGIAGWRQGVKRRLLMDVGEKWFEGVGGSTDSEWAFALFLDCLEKLGAHADDETKMRTGFGHTILRKAMLQTISRINNYHKDLPPPPDGHSVEHRSLLNFAVTDGKSVVCTRYVSSKTDEPASLFFSSGTSWREQSLSSSTNSNAVPKPGKGEYKMERRDKGADIVLVASEPLTFERDNWVTVPANSVLTIHNQTVLIHPIVDEFYNHKPLPRSAAFAADKGQMTSPVAESKTNAASKLGDDGLLGGKGVGVTAVAA